MVGKTHLFKNLSETLKPSSLALKTILTYKQIFAIYSYYTALHRTVGTSRQIAFQIPLASFLFISKFSLLIFDF